VIELLAAGDLESDIKSLALRIVTIASLIIIVTTIVAVINKNRLEWLKLPLFAIIAGTIVISTLVLVGNTIRLNVVSESGGPVHWHTDIEFWACGTELEFRNPTGFLSNKIGTSTYHEHNDKRIHLEGVVVQLDRDASLRKFMSVTDGYIQPEGMAIALNEDNATWFAEGDKFDGDPQGTMDTDFLSRYVKTSADTGLPVAEFADGQLCDDGTPGEVQAFLYSFNKENETYSQTKLDNPADYIMRDESIVPPGDCLIVEFDGAKDRTDKLCEQFGVRDSRRCVEFGVENFNPDLCSLEEVTTSGGSL